MNQQKVSLEQAVQEVEAWLNRKRILPNKREKLVDAIDQIVSAVMYGQVSIDQESGVITQNLLFPIKDENGSDAISSLTYKARLTVSELDQKTSKGATASSTVTGEMRLRVAAAALTCQPLAVIGKLDTEDNAVSQSIAVFFL